MAEAREIDGALDFEAAYAALQEMVEQLEAGGLPLEETLALYERGMRLVAHCSRHLDGAELRVLEIEAALGESLAALAEPDLPGGRLRF